MPDWVWFWKKKIDSVEYLELKRLIFNLEIEVEQIQLRFKKKIKPKPDEEDLKDTEPYPRRGMLAYRKK